jgi:branched-chain amino acid transport system permease protein
VTVFGQLLIAGVALGGVYALVALGFTVIYRASTVINFAQGQLLVLGAYFVSTLTLGAHLPFWMALVLGVAATALVGAVFQAGILNRVLGQPVFTLVMITLGLGVALNAFVPAVWGGYPRPVGDPWGNSFVSAGGLVLNWVKVWTIISAGLVLVAFYMFNRFSRYGLAMRAAAMDQEAALAVGIPVRRVFVISWALAGAVGAVAGVFLAGYPNALEPTMGDAALRAFPAIILGGLDSPPGAVVGGLAIGIVEVLTAGYQPQLAPWLGHNFYLIAPYLVMIAVLLVRPYGLFGSRPAEKV